MHVGWSFLSSLFFACFLNSNAHFYAAVNTGFEDFFNPIRNTSFSDFPDAKVKHSVHILVSVLKITSDLGKCLDFFATNCDLMAKIIEAYFLIEKGHAPESAEAKLIYEWGNRLKDDILHVTNVVESGFRHLEAVSKNDDFYNIALYPVKHLINSIENAFFETKSSLSIVKLVDNCHRHDPENLLTSLKEHMLRGAFLKQNEAADYDEKNFKRLEKLYRETVHLISLANIICNSVICIDKNVKCSINQYDPAKRKTAEIFNRIKEDYKARKELYWDVIDKIVESILFKMEAASNQEVAQTVADKLAVMYPEWDDFDVGVYNYSKKAKKYEWYKNISPKQFTLVENLRKRSVFVYRRSKVLHFPTPKCSADLFMKNTGMMCESLLRSKPLKRAMLYVQKFCQNATFIGMFQGSLDFAVSKIDPPLFSTGMNDYLCITKNGWNYNYHDFDINWVFGW